VPDVVGMTRVKAEGVIRQAGYHYTIVLKVTDYPSDGTVLAQDPAPGSPLRPGGEVVLEVAKAPPDAKLTVPRVIGLERSVAERMLRDAGFLVNVTLGGGGPHEQGLVTDQAPVGDALAPRRTWVEIVVASGTGPRVEARGGPPVIGPVAGPRQPAPDDSAGLSGPPAVPPGRVVMPPPMPTGPAPIPRVELPPRDAAKTATVPTARGMMARDAIAAVLKAGLIPIIEVDRDAGKEAGTVVGQSPEGGTGALPGDLVRLSVASGPGEGRYTDLPMAVGGLVTRARTMLARSGIGVDVIEVQVPGHPYAGTGRVAAQYPVSRMPSRHAARVTLWTVTK
jgi:beta-lactam-binding protein with PASTA domain